MQLIDVPCTWARVADCPPGGPHPQSGSVSIPFPDISMNLEAWRHYLRGVTLQRRKRPLQAMDEFRSTLAYDSGFARAAHALAYLLAEDGRDEEAEYWFREALRLQPKNAAIWFNLGFFYDRRQRPTDAVEAMSEAVRLDPKLDTAWYGLGLALAAQGHHAEAARAFERAAVLQPMNGEVWYHLGMAHHASGNDERVKDVARYLNRFDRKMTKSLIVHSGRKDLEHLVADYDPRF
jgi:tetratricopeptide (TPR) repeat protein